MDVLEHADMLGTLSEVGLSAWTHDYIRNDSPNVSNAVAIIMSSRTELLYHQQANSSGFVVPDVPNPRNAQSINGPLVSGLPAASVSCLTSRFIGGILSIPSSSMEGAPDLLFLGDQQLSGGPAPGPPPAPQIPLPGPLRPSQKHCPPSALEDANVDDALRLPPLCSQSVISAPTPRTAMSSLENLDTFIHTLRQELHHSSKYAQLHVQL
jgi:hypothetical protein